MSRSITRWLAVLMALAGCIAAAAPAVAAPAVAAPGSTIVRPDDPRLRFMGHWGHTANAAITVNSGSELTFGFTGHTLHGLFDTSTITVPSQIYVSIDFVLILRHTVSTLFTYTTLSLLLLALVFLVNWAL